ncbi:HAMP domain-containing histidine kinase [Dactylosporangium vinaceum]|uniref:histidine kinase n=1 Tax=Dactylosporangium vinaceum TaxID=53362 RepID=A0ABV5MBW4_9ACTN|nr:HAMP domain-containing sensor histidine kinase [Dactylosporangium vinaceum]UAC01312.1 HAMP domain-containing histidine kinase [Dactylosporangium vinaceum]
MTARLGTARSRLRRQLTLLYAGPFLLSGAVLLGVQMLGVRQSAPVGSQDGPPPDVTIEAGRGLMPLTVILLAVMLLVALVLGWVIAGRFLRPLRLIIDTSRDISASNLHRRLGPTGRRDEFGELSETLDDLFGRLEASFAAQRRFVANASHELRTPLTAQRALLQVTLANRTAPPEELRAAAQEVLKLGDAQARLIDSLLSLATGEQGVEYAEPLDLADIVQDVLDMRHIDGRDDDWLYVDITLDPAPTTGDADLIDSLVANLVDNAVKHNVDGGSLIVSTGIVEGRPTLTVENTGPEVPVEDLERLFQPFQRLGTQRVRTSAEGYGLGLAIVRAIAGAHGAELDAAPREGGGLRVTVIFR